MLSAELFWIIQIGFISVIVLYGAGALIPYLAYRNSSLQIRLAHGAAIGASAAGILLGAAALFVDAPPVFSISSNLPLLTIQFRLDPLSAFFVAMISLVGLAASIYAIGYTREFQGRYPVGILGSFYNAFLLSMTLVVMADNAFLFLILWEVMSLSSFFLVVTEHEKAETRYAGFFYIVMAHLGTAFIMATFLLFYDQAEDFSFEAFRTSGQVIPETLKTIIFCTALIGFGTKAGIVPLHLWLPYAHPAAPSHVSALMSGVMIKTAIYGLIRIYFDLLGGEFPWWWGFTLFVSGAISALLGVMYALMEHDLKSLLAYHSVENIGIIMLGLGAGMVFQSYGLPHMAALGLLAALYHTLNHAVFKALLFLGAGSILHTTHTRNMEEYGGLIRHMPWTALFFLIGAVSISALPPSNGFVSEWLTFQSLFLSFMLPDLLVKILFPVGAAMLALTGALALACFVKAFGITFLAKPRSPHARQAREVPHFMRIGMGFLAVLCAVLGLAPMMVIPMIDQVIVPFTQNPLAQSMIARQGWALMPMGVGFAGISTPVLGALLCLVVLVGLGIAAAIRRLQIRRYRTWGCGLNLSARMEYTATGFVQPIRQIFGTIYRPTVKLEKEFLEESSYFAKRMRFEFHIEPVFQKYLYSPFVKWLMAASERLAVIQAGRIQVYLVYIFLALVGLLLWIR